MRKMSIIEYNYSNFENLIKQFEDGLKLTLNQGLTYETSKNPLVDLFGMGASLRHENDLKRIFDLFSKAAEFDRQLALRCLFYLRDIRGGQGERKVFRMLLLCLSVKNPELITEKLFKWVIEYGRWDDLYVFVDSPFEEKMFAFMKAQFDKDLESEHPTLLGKWLKSINTSSDRSKYLGQKTRKAFGLSEKKYRKKVSALRSKINVVEKKMSAGKWDAIDFEKVPSRAAMIYRNSFQNQQPERYSEYLSQVESGEKEIKTQTLYPYDIVRKLMTKGVNKTLELQWENLPNYVAADQNAIVVCDTSGSMYQQGSVRPIDIAISLSIYFAERNNGLFKNKFITFSERPTIQEIVGDSLYERIQNLSSAHWAMNTNIQSTFRVLLDLMIKTKMDSNEEIKTIYIISDMEFDYCINDAKKIDTTLNVMREEFEKAGYSLPDLVFWNVNSHQNNMPFQENKGILGVSGASPVLFEYIMNSQEKGEIDSFEFIKDILNSERYSQITI